jgi:hypothetical protein
VTKDSKQLTYECSTTSTVSVTLALTSGEHIISIGDVSTPQTPGFPYTLAIVKRGAAMTEKDTPTDARPFPAPLLVFIVLGLVFLVIPLVLTGEKSRIPRFIDPGGVTMRNGAHFPWHEYRGVRVLSERRASSGYSTEVGVELIFARGTALIRYRPITNPAEVLWITDQLKQGRNPFAA